MPKALSSVLTKRVLPIAFSPTLLTRKKRGKALIVLLLLVLEVLALNVTLREFVLGMKDSLS